MRKNSSIDTLASKFKNMDIALISLIQASYQARNIDAILEAYNKHKIKNNKKITTMAKASLLGLGRQASQYIAMISKPTLKEIKRVEKKQKVLLRKDYEFNLNLMGNRKREKIESIPEGEKERIGGGTRKDKILLDILSLGGLGIVIKKDDMNYQTIIKVQGKATKMDFLHRINLTTNQIKILNSNGIYQIQVLLKLKMKDLSETWISTKTEQLRPSYNLIEKLIDETEEYILESDPYEIDSEIQIIESYNKLVIYWKN